MTTLVLLDADRSPAGVLRRLREELARQDLSDTAAARRYEVPQQWVSRRMTGHVDWKVSELEDFCDTLGLSYLYVATGVREVFEAPPASPHPKARRRGKPSGPENEDDPVRRRSRRIDATCKSHQASALMHSMMAA